MQGPTADTVSAVESTSRTADTGSAVESVAEIGSKFGDRLPSILIAVLVFAAFFVIGRLLRAVVRRITGRTRLDAQRSIVFSRLISAIATVLGFLAAIVVIIPEFNVQDVVTGLGVASIAAGFVFREILQNFFAGLLMLWRQPFQIGDEITTGEFAGRVEVINSRSTRIATYGGERVIVPNSNVYNNPILVHTAFPNRRIDFMVGVGYGDSIELARERILSAVRDTPGVRPNPEPWAYVEELAPSSVNFHVYFWTGSEQENVLKVRDAVATRIKLSLDEANIDIPYPHRVVLLRNETTEGPASRE